MFRILDNVPEIYINESRDFQLLARLSDVLFSGIRYDIDSIINILDPMLATDTLLDLMCTKVGFFPRINIDAQVLKYILASFPYIIKNKGNKLGIEYAVNAVLKAEASDLEKSKAIVQITNNLGTNNSNNYVVKILTAVEIYNKAALKEVLRYVVPAGYHILILTYSNISEYKPDIFTLSDIITTMKINRYNSGTIRSASSESSDIITEIKSKLEDNQREARRGIYANNYIATEIVTANTPQLINEGNS